MSDRRAQGFVSFVVWEEEIDLTYITADKSQTVTIPRGGKMEAFNRDTGTLMFTLKADFLPAPEEEQE